ncbi:peptidoglycan DD-metalloendopeptidase family protein [Spiribacter sp. C176]|uniref:Peptidoglycan DD-metalloendopeptidase family protein n=1 Tax=Spiribacter salilacus TaxID=2664894 RepID=A0A6N7QTT7_9GAMM|nr:M23 family metallopeptidase [Spiribacter salilacus]MRH78819.1 peptidoglycan DD-metalloendopeptidase family protein [Spiribacter salilacus]
MRYRGLLILAFMLLGHGMSTALALEWKGQAIQGGLLTGYVDSGANVEALGQSISVMEDGRFLLGLGREAPAELDVVVIKPNGDRQNYLLSIEQRDYDIQRIDGLPDSQVTPDEQTLQRIRAEAARVRAAREQRFDTPFFDTGWIWPVTGPITGVYGSQRILNGQPRQPHYGIDIAAATGTPVKAPADGVVTLVEPDLFFSGGTLIVDHGHGLSSSFLHLASIDVELGQRVQRGDTIATVGATGRVTGAHLDWRMNWFDQRIDPTLVLNQ